MAPVQKVKDRKSTQWKKECVKSFVINYKPKNEQLETEHGFLIGIVLIKYSEFPITSWEELNVAVEHFNFVNLYCDRGTI